MFWSEARTAHAEVRVFQPTATVVPSVHSQKSAPDPPHARRPAAPSPSPPGVAAFTCVLSAEEEKGCCFCSSNEMPSDLFMNYLFGTALLCSVRFFQSSLESRRSVIADATLCHPEFALTSCEPSGRAISILARPWACWRWE